jgi:hypothetical protein
MQASGFPPPLADAFMRAGLCMSHVQYAESALRRALVYAFPETEPITLETVERGNDETRRATLGNLVRRLRDRGVEIEPAFDNFLDEFVQQRNMFVHHIHLDDAYNIGTDDGLARFNEFVQRLTGGAYRVTVIFTAIALAFTNGQGRFVMTNLPDDQQDAYRQALLGAVRPDRFVRKP